MLSLGIVTLPPLRSYDERYFHSGSFASHVTNPSAAKLGNPQVVQVTYHTNFPPITLLISIFAMLGLGEHL